MSEEGASSTSEMQNSLNSDFTSKKVSDHLANERTMLAWIRTGLAIITLGFVVERFGLFLRELGVRSGAPSVLAVPYSAFIGITLTLLGIVCLIAALINFLQVRRSIERGQFHPSISFVVFLTLLSCVVGCLLAVYLLFSM